MATNDQEQPAQESGQGGEQKFRYKLQGSKGDGERVDRVVLEGTTMDPVRFIDLHGEAEMTEEEAESVRKNHRVDLRKVGNVESVEDNSGDESEAEKARGEAPVVETKADQQNAQRATSDNPTAGLKAKQTKS